MEMVEGKGGGWMRGQRMGQGMRRGKKDEKLMVNWEISNVMNFSF